MNFPACLTHPELADECLELRSSPSVGYCLEDQRHPHPLEQILVVGWVGVLPLFARTNRTCATEGTSSFCFLWCFLVHTLYTLVNIFSSGYFIPLCLCDFNIRCIRIHSLCTLQSFLFIFGERTGSLLGIISLYISDLDILIFSHPSYS